MKSSFVASLLSTACSVIALLATGPAQAQTEELFATRSPQACPAPVRGKPGTKDIEALIRCTFEGKTGSRITLVEDIKVETGGTRAYNQFADGYATGIDTAEKVMPIRGSMTTYQCDKLSKLSKVQEGRYYVDNANKNCLVVKQPNAEGKCYKTTFGDWKCSMQQLVSPENFLMDQPPPRS